MIKTIIAMLIITIIITAIEIIAKLIVTIIKTAIKIIIVIKMNIIKTWKIKNQKK